MFGRKLKKFIYKTRWSTEPPDEALFTASVYDKLKRNGVRERHVVSLDSKIETKEADSTLKRRQVVEVKAWAV